MANCFTLAPHIAEAASRSGADAILRGSFARQAGRRLLRICPTGGTFEDKAYPLEHEQMTLAQPCPCADSLSGASETPTSTSVFKDLVG